VSAASRNERCAAAHAANTRPCEGQPDAVRIVDQTGAGTGACLLHGAVLLASLCRGRVYPLNGPRGSAIAVYARARELLAFDVPTGVGVGHVPTMDEAAVSSYPPEPTWPGVEAPASGRLDGDGGDDAGHRGVSGNAFWVQRRNAGHLGPATATNGDGNAWSGPGNARSSPWFESCVSRLRGTA
jgi:hypothetical protein